MDKGFPQAIVLQTVACVFLCCVGSEGEAHILFAPFGASMRQEMEKNRRIARSFK